MGMYFIAWNITDIDYYLFMCLLMVLMFGVLFAFTAVEKWLKRQLPPPKPPENAHTVGTHNVNAKDKYGRTLLHCAARCDDSEDAKLLLAKGANVNAKDELGQTPLHEAAHWGRNTEVAELLINNGADVNAEDEFGGTPLHDAARKGHSEDAKLLLAKLLLAKGANINAKDKAYDTPLHLAAENGNTEVAKLLINNGADIDAKDGDGKTPLQVNGVMGVRLRRWQRGEIE